MPKLHSTHLALARRSVPLFTALAAMAFAAPALAAPQRNGDERDDDDDDDDADDDDNERDTTRDDGRGDVDGAEDSHLRVHVDSEALGGAWSRNANGDDSLTFGAGLARPSLLDHSAVFSRPLFGFGLGWVFARDRAVLGAKMGLSVDGYDLDSSRRATSVGARFVPYFHWMFLPGRAVRPYAEGRIGLGGGAISTDPGAGGRRTDRLIYPIVGAGAGVHIFPRNYFSVDLGFNVDYARPYASTVYRDAGTPDTDWRKSADVLNFGVLLGLSTWF